MVPRFSRDTTTLRAGSIAARPSVRPVWAVLIVLGMLLIGMRASLASIGNDTVVTPSSYSSEKLFWTNVLPEGWAFFSKSQRDPLVTPFIKDESGVLVSVSKFPSTQAEYLWGVSRNARAQGVEIGYLASQVPASEWHKCESRQAAECIEELDSRPGFNPTRVNNPSPLNPTCGDVYLIENEPVAWSYRNLTEQKTVPVRSAHITVHCEAK